MLTSFRLCLFCRFRDAFDLGSRSRELSCSELGFFERWPGLAGKSP